MKAKFLGVMTLALLVILVFGVAAQVAVAQSTNDAIIQDAKDNGTIDGDWTAAQVNGALEYLQNNPIYTQYSDYEGVLEDYLASLSAPGEQGGQLAFTGSEILLILGAGAGLIGSGAVLRRRRA